ncbi:hypothetical protein AKJ50_00060 [candidate division MSBL1 archaeon SCGC-AAA382A13]|uniref:Uncharacterized protein n=2 Tax=candidate division MSBL1 TaxID=215777 RepID=A0A133VEB3_9EURY|nr:hypothetical protein AKJ49_01685 [candidate division MSBL1 archaeon SCGC-AAA382A03]KXB05727.1 hypothetical protein AKJ50_00060 [candidate division MSBL1 archaeon SCGC-AAA382A13]
MTDRTPGIIETLTGNKKIEFGILSLIIALILGFSAIYVQTEIYSDEGNLNSTQVVRIEKTGLNAQGELYLNYKDSNSYTNIIKVNILNQNRNIINSTELDPGENKKLILNSGATFFRKEENHGVISYNYYIYYSHYPYGLLSIPALILTIFGVISVLKGFNQYVNTVAREKEKSNADEKEENIDFMGVKKKEEE